MHVFLFFGFYKESHYDIWVQIFMWTFVFMSLADKGNGETVTAASYIFAFLRHCQSGFQCGGVVHVPTSSVWTVAVCIFVSIWWASLARFSSFFFNFCKHRIQPLWCISQWVAVCLQDVQLSHCLITLRRTLYLLAVIVQFFWVSRDGPHGGSWFPNQGLQTCAHCSQSAESYPLNQGSPQIFLIEIWLPFFIYYYCLIPVIVLVYLFHW